MAWEDFEFTPEDGLENTTTFESKPVSGARARQQFTTILNQIKTFLNGTVKETSADLATHKADNAAHNGFVGRYQALPSFTDFNELTTSGIYHGVISGEILNEAVVVAVTRRLTLQVNTNSGVNVYQELHYLDAGSSRTHRRFFRQRKNATDWWPWVEITTSRDVARGQGSPEGVISATVGTLYQRTDGGAGTTLYVKESGTGNTGWIAK